MTQITEPAISKYMRSKDRTLEGALTEYSLYFLMVRYGLELQIKTVQSNRTPLEIVNRLIFLFDEFEKACLEDPELKEKMIAIVELEQESLLYKSDL
tara:strand:- start:544 stop:834 length:291 start_codon:yes stop_codon:yes gene_type:complete